ncbi:MAG TPA: hypothetical protein VHJ20_13530, partial [Polyangia bacterium]|nr:hypothetical protein [Polyangia bacterium]
GRAAFATGGSAALAARLESTGADVVAADADLAALAQLAVPAGAAPPEGALGAIMKAPKVTTDLAKIPPAEAYAEGMHARLGGDSSRAAELFSHALAGHADACRAAGEYIAALRALKRHADNAAFAALRVENSGCVNLPPP